MRKIYIVGKWGRGYASWMQGEIVDNMEDADLVLFTGGEDVCPYFYEKSPHPATFYNYERDQFERAQFVDAFDKKKKMIGICRGAQFLCVMAGGSLVQHQSHPARHPMKTSDGDTIIVTSTHHQRQYPWGYKKPKFELLGWCDNLSPYSEGTNRKDDMSGKPEVEIALYPDIRALAIQSHPEMAYPAMSGSEAQFIEYCRKILDQHMGDSDKVKVKEKVVNA